MITTIHLRRVLRDSIRMYFAPLTGAFKGIRAELQHTDKEITRHREAEQKLAKTKHA